MSHKTVFFCDSILHLTLGENIKSEASTGNALTNKDSSKSEDKEGDYISNMKQLIYHLKNIGEQNNCLAKEQKRSSEPRAIIVLHGSNATQSVRKCTG